MLAIIMTVELLFQVAKVLRPYLEKSRKALFTNTLNQIFKH